MSGKPTGLVMLVDDDAIALEMYRRGLEPAGLRAVAFHDAGGLFAAIESQVPDVVVLDWNLPGMTGGDIFRLLREDRRTRRTPVIFLSNYSGGLTDLESEMRSRGAFDWLVKARTTPQGLALRVRGILERSAQKAS